MNAASLLAAPASAALLLLSGCSTPPASAPPDVPMALRPPAGQTLYLQGAATGVQIYECAAKADQPTAYEWAFRAPEATLVDSSGKPIIKHYGGPTWESVADGSAIVGDLKARDAGPTPTAIPWLLLSVKSKRGSGVMSQAQSVQRIRTAGGNAPADTCGPSNLRQVARVPYTAVYYFYRSAA